MTSEVIKAKIDAEFNLGTPEAPVGSAGIITPGDGLERDGVFYLEAEWNVIKKYSKVIASACEGNAERTDLTQATLKVLNVVPGDHKLSIRLSISGGPIFCRVHAVAYN